MSQFSGMFGANLINGSTYAVDVAVNQQVAHTPAEDFVLDPYLPAIATDRLNPAGALVIGPGRFVGVGFSGGRGTGYSASQTVGALTDAPDVFRSRLIDMGKTPLTIADGRNITPLGMNVNRVFRETTEYMLSRSVLAPVKNFDAKVPFVSAVNNANGTIRCGDHVTAYSGSTTSAMLGGQAPTHRGKPVKWLARRVMVATSTASAIFSLAAATNAGIVPHIHAAFAAGTLVTGLTATLTHNGTNWICSFIGTGSGTVTEVHFSYGHDEDHIGGQVFSLKSLVELSNEDPFLKFVETNFNSTELPPRRPAMQRYHTTDVNDETPTTVVANSLYRTLQGPIDIYRPIVVEVSNATVTDANGGSTSYATGTWFQLPTNNQINGFANLVGQFHAINWFKREIEISSNIRPITGSAIAVRVSYSYHTDPKDAGVLWGAGILGLTDGQNITPGASVDGTQVTPSNPYGVPAFLNLTDVVGVMKIFVR